MLCPIVWTAPFGFANVMRRAVPLTREDQLHRLETCDFPDWDYMPGGPKDQFEHKESDWGYLDGRLVSRTMLAQAPNRQRRGRKTWLRDFDIYRLDLSDLLPLTSPLLATPHC